MGAHFWAAFAVSLFGLALILIAVYISKIADAGCLIAIVSVIGLLLLLAGAGALVNLVGGK